MAGGRVNAVKYVVHDVLQNSVLTRVQRAHLGRRHERKTPFEAFRLAMDLFSDYPMTLACLGEGVVETEWVNYIKQRPLWRVQCHGLRHARYDLMDESQAKEELRMAKECLEEVFSTIVSEFYPPCNKYSNQTQRIAGEVGMAEQRRFRRPSHFKRALGRAHRVDMHYWNLRDVEWAVRIRDQIKMTPLFIIGAPRSGTTAYMRWLADTLPKSLALKEREHIWKDGFDRKLYYTQALLDNDRRTIVDKNCRNSLRLDKLLSDFPDAHFIHVIRDGRAVAHSWQKWAVKTNKPNQSLQAAAIQWQYYIEAIREAKLTSYEEVRYEDFCKSDPYFKDCNFKWQAEMSEADKAEVTSWQEPTLRELGYL